MKILKTIMELGRLPRGCVLCVGNFDGVHIGHKEILEAAGRTAAEKATFLVALTFEPHPVAILHPEKAPGVLTPLELKTHLLADLGIDYLIVLKDTASLLRLTPADFIDKFLIKDIKPLAVVEGDDFHFGAGRKGTIDTLKQMAAQNGFDVIVVPAKTTRLSTGQIVRVSSTTIRYMLEAGHVADAASLLGRQYRLVGKIIQGKGRGKKLGFPTLNMQKPIQVIPAEGVYAGFVSLGKSESNVCCAAENRPAVFSIGQAGTFGDDFPLLIEAHVLTGDIGKVTDNWLAMDFVERLRSQHKFNTPDDLARQIAKDCETAKSILR